MPLYENPWKERRRRKHGFVQQSMFGADHFFFLPFILHSLSLSLRFPFFSPSGELCTYTRRIENKKERITDNNIEWRWSWEKRRMKRRERKREMAFFFKYYPETSRERTEKANLPQSLTKLLANQQQQQQQLKSKLFGVCMYTVVAATVCVRVSFHQTFKWNSPWAKGKGREKWTPTSSSCRVAQSSTVQCLVQLFDIAKKSEENKRKAFS